VLLGGIAVFLLASVLATYASSPGALIAARTLMGVERQLDVSGCDRNLSVAGDR
jgi:hypothetical protein